MWKAADRSPLKGHDRHVHAQAASPDGKSLAAAVSGAGVRRWSLPGRSDADDGRRRRHGEAVGRPIITLTISILTFGEI